MTVFGRSLNGSKLSKQSRGRAAIRPDFDLDAYKPLPAVPAPPSCASQGLAPDAALTDFGVMSPSPSLPVGNGSVSERASASKFVSRSSFLRLGSTLGLGRKLSKRPPAATSALPAPLASEPPTEKSFGPVLDIDISGPITDPLRTPAASHDPIDIQHSAPSDRCREGSRMGLAALPVEDRVVATAEVQTTPRRRVASTAPLALSVQEHRNSLRSPGSSQRAGREWRARIAALAATQAAAPPSPRTPTLVYRSSASTEEKGPVTPPPLLRKGYGPLPPPRRRLAKAPAGAVGSAGTGKAGPQGHDSGTESTSIPSSTHRDTPRPARLVTLNDTAETITSAGSLIHRQPSVPLSVFTLSLDQMFGPSVADSEEDAQATETGDTPCGSEIATPVSSVAPPPVQAGATALARSRSHGVHPFARSQPISATLHNVKPPVLDEQHVNVPRTVCRPSGVVLSKTVYPMSPSSVRLKSTKQAAFETENEDRLTPGSAGGKRPPRSGMPKSEMEKWLSSLRST